MPGPPPPPPPPMLGGGGAAPGAGAGRGQLLGAIHKGVALKKTVTNDRSAPIAVPAKSGAGPAPPTGGSRGPIRPGNGMATGNGNPGNGGPALGGLFAGGMPKLKPTNRGAGESAVPAPPRGAAPNGPTGGHSPMPTTNRGAGESAVPAPPRGAAPNGPTGGHSPMPTTNGPTGNKRVFPADVKNRGPPPQPPPAAHKPALAGSASEGRLSGGVRTHGKPYLAPRPPSDPPHAQRVVSRAQSLRAPRSPPVLPPGAPPPSFDSRMQQMHASGLHQSQGSLPDYRTLPSKGGGERPRPPLTRPPPPPSRPPPPPVKAPPPPPHRTLPAAPPSPAVSHGYHANNANNVNNANRLQPGPPPTPARNSSMRGGAAAEPFERNFTWRDAKEFPQPPPFRGLPKVFNSVSVRLAGAGGKAQAPQPPVLQLGNKMFTRDTSRC